MKSPNGFNFLFSADRSIYHALGYGVFMYLKAVMTFEQKHIEEASNVLRYVVIG